MNTKLYRKCALYRSLFKEDLFVRMMQRNQRRYRKYLQDQARIIKDFYQEAIKDGKYDEALELQYYYNEVMKRL